AAGRPAVPADRRAYRLLRRGPRDGWQVPGEPAGQKDAAENAIDLQADEPGRRRCVEHLADGVQENGSFGDLLRQYRQAAGACCRLLYGTSASSQTNRGPVIVRGARLKKGWP